MPDFSQLRTVRVVIFSMRATSSRSISWSLLGVIIANGTWLASEVQDFQEKPRKPVKLLKRGAMVSIHKTSGQRKYRSYKGE